MEYAVEDQRVEVPGRVEPSAEALPLHRRNAPSVSAGPGESGGGDQATRSARSPHLLPGARDHLEDGNILEDRKISPRNQSWVVGVNKSVLNDLLR